ncbi:ceramidase domain-containing protein [Yoonia sp. 208BN28-4]|uniref:ceramidase domain-containing protein n=1 Tax=Yoonia sp. 208BN28-4 TaxID=3126505 RepID=UPI00309B4C93
MEIDWTRQIDGYCERLTPAFWAEPINAVTNAAFIIAAIIMLLRVRGNPMAQLLSVIMLCIGIGSFLFHTVATAWAALADTAPIGIFILVYLYAVTRTMLGFGRLWSLAITALFIPFAAVVVPLVSTVPFLAISGFYWTVPILLVIYAVIIRRQYPQAARGFVIGAALLSVSIIARSLDEVLCDSLPIGTHFLWHCLNAVMLAYMIHVYHRHWQSHGRAHVLAAGRTGR